MSSPTLLLLIRHAEQETLREIDPPLSVRGRRQADLLGERFAHLPIAAIAASPLQRAQQTAEPLARHLGLSVQVFEDLHEARTSAESMRHVFTHTSAAAMEPHPDDYTGPALASVDVLPRFVWGKDGFSETGEQIRARMTQVLDTLIAAHPGEVIVCISHGGAINCALGAWVDVSKDMWFVPWHTGVNGVFADGAKRTVLFINDASHLSEGQDPISVVSAGLADRASEHPRGEQTVS